MRRKKGILKLRNEPGMSFGISDGFGTNPFLRDAYGRFEANYLGWHAAGPLTLTSSGEDENIRAGQKRSKMHKK